MADTQVPAYVVTGTRPEMIRNERGLMERGIRVDIRFADGNTNYVEVPYTPDWSDHAKVKIEELHAHHSEMMGFQGPMVNAPQRPGMVGANRRVGG